MDTPDAFPHLAQLFHQIVERPDAAMGVLIAFIGAFRSVD
jgi:hypothetical protein